MTYRLKDDLKDVLFDEASIRRRQFAEKIALTIIADHRNDFYYIDKKILARQCFAMANTMDQVELENLFDDQEYKYDPKEDSVGDDHSS